MKHLSFIALLVCLKLSAVYAQSYPQAILKGDYPDPTIIRDGGDFYMTHSPFIYKPGFLIWHSTDLFNWQPITRVIPEFEGSAMAPDLVKYNNKYYIYYPAAGTNWVVWADDIRGPWSQPINLHVGYIDPGHVVGADGKRYLYLSEGMIVQLADDGLSTVGEPEQVYDGWDYPQRWVTEGKYLEAPKLIQKDGYFYMLSAEGGTAGPATSHMIIVARSKNVNGPWENSPYNPLVRTYHESDNWWSKGHGTLIDDVHGNWWVVYHAYANGYHTLGRQTLIEPVEWTTDGWLKAGVESPDSSIQDEQLQGKALSDNFSEPNLGLQWTAWKTYSSKNITLKNNSLMLAAQGSSPVDAHKLLVTPTDKTYSVQVEVQVEKGNTAGLMLFTMKKHLQVSRQTVKISRSIPMLHIINLQNIL